eukprot:TRINITY_DN35680_c0_g1_i1.p2 TRINITY_DN35680_c0_g1~~TRINITY_DN35680_c0_g1_i1.p2  ORF type:complete len:124 (+),score=15.33 TRINITY_DN35680_c0_g1_i1:51-374(+)
MWADVHKKAKKEAKADAKARAKIEARKKKMDKELMKKESIDDLLPDEDQINLTKRKFIKKKKKKTNYYSIRLACVQKVNCFYKTYQYINNLQINIDLNFNTKKIHCY